MKPISFCINVSINTKEHVELLLKSLEKNLNNKYNEILVFVDDDNENTTEFLINQKKNFFNLKVITHNLPAVVGYCRNINLMVEYAKHDIVSYLQSDMVISKDYDIHINEELEENTILCSTRIEPPLHPGGPEKIVQNFGIEPKKFEWDNFLNFASNARSNKTTNYFFVPFSFYKKVWVDIGGYDTLFRRGREDSDLPQRLLHKGINIKHSFNLNVYHFTCVASRGKEWFKNEDKIQNRVKLQDLALEVETRNFIRKWGRLEHGNPNNIPLNKLDIDLIIKDTEISSEYAKFIYNIEPYFSRVWLPTKGGISLKENILNICKQECVYANQIMNFTYEQWENESKFYNTVNYDTIYNIGTPKDFNVKVEVDLKQNPREASQFIQFFDYISDMISNEGLGKYELDPFYIEVKNIINVSKTHIYANNPPFDKTLINIK